MSKTKLFAGVLLVLAVLFAQVGTALAAPAAQDTTPIPGTIQSITTETVNGVTTVVVTFLTGTGESQTVHLSVDTALSLGLVTVDTTTNVVTPDTTKVGQTVEIDPTKVIPAVVQTTDEAVHPIAAILAKFFGVEPSVVQGYHDDGYGFGVIAQAMWMAKGLSEGSETMVDAGLILAAKKSGDYSAFILTDGTTPTNWGQFKKAVMGKDKKNLGIIVSGHADTTEETPMQGNRQGNGQGNGNGHGKDNNPGKGKNKP